MVQHQISQPSDRNMRLHIWVFRHLLMLIFLMVIPLQHKQHMMLDFERSNERISRMNHVPKMIRIIILPQIVDRQMAFLFSSGQLLSCVGCEHNSLHGFSQDHVVLLLLVSILPHECHMILLRIRFLKILMNSENSIVDQNLFHIFQE